MKNRETFGWYLRNQFKLFLADLVSSPFVVILAIAARYFSRDDKIDFGLGPTPIINLVNHKKALVRAGFRAETFVDTVWHQTTAFDLRFDLLHPNWLSRRFAAHYVFARMIFRYKAVYVYFSGGAFRNQTFLRLLEPALLRLAGVKTVVLAFGADVQELKRTPNFHLVNGMARDYPTHRFIQGKIRRSIWAWTSMADYIVGGCDWVDYLYYWDRLCVSHFAIDTQEWPPATQDAPKLDDLVVLHAPNHRAIKGTAAIIAAVDALRSEGCKIRLRLLEGVPNTEIKQAIRECDLVVDQLVIGWYAMFSIEAMASGKPTICFLRPDLLAFYRGEGLIDVVDPPLIQSSLLDIKETLRRCSEDRAALRDIGRRGPAYVERHHSIDAIGALFKEINDAIGIAPSDGSLMR